MKTSLKWRLAQKIELQWWKNYLKNKPTNDYLTWKKDYWRNLLQQLPSLPLGKAQRVLDAGCGPSGMYSVLNQKHIDAIDPLIEAYEKDLSHFNKKDYPQVQFYNDTLEQYTTDTPYDTVFCMNAINHVSDINQSVDKLISLTAKKGFLVLSIDAHNYAFFKHLFRLLPGDVLHPHQYDLTEYQNMLIQRNCRIVQTLRLKQHFFFDYYVLVAERKD